MNAAHLHAVPDPEPDPPVDDQLEIPPVGDVDGGEERSGWIPSLRPYYDVRPLAELGPLAVEVSRVGGPPLLRATGRGLRALTRGLLVLARGVGVLLVVLAGWLSGNIGRGSIGARFAGAGFVMYAVAKTATRYPYARWFVLLALLAAVILAGLGHIKAPESKTQKKTPAKKGAGKKSKRAPVEDDDAETPEVSKEDAPAEPRRGLLGRLAGHLKNSGDVDREEDNEEAPEGDEKEVPEIPQEDPLTTLLREAIGSENGVHLGDLRPLMRDHLPGLSQATDEELRKHLTAAGYDPSRKFRARGVAGRAGVHRTDLPPPPSPEGASRALSGPLSGGGEGPRPANFPESGEQRRAAGEGAGRGYRIVQDAERGPSAWKIEYDQAD
ncbi:hypothetical protein ACWC9U_30590 [Streptomyces sp. 900116325]